MSRQITILIVDDESVGRDALEGPLFSQGYTLVFAENGLEALQKANDSLPDIILLDVMMPGMDGYEVCRQLRADPKLHDVPVLLVTALDDRLSRIRGIEAGADDFISKPFDRNELRVRVRTITRLNRYRRLLSEQAKFAWVVAQSEEGYLIVGEDGDIQYANPKARLYLNLSPTEEGITDIKFFDAAKKIFRMEPVDRWKKWPDIVNDVSAPLFFVRPETQQTTALWLHLNVFELPESQNRNLLVRMRDVTSQMVLQREMWTFHSTIFHKLKIPITDIFCSLELLSGHIDDMSKDEIKTFAQSAFRGVRTLKGHVEDILQYLSGPIISASAGVFELKEFDALIEKVKSQSGVENISVTYGRDLGNMQIGLSEQAFEVVLMELLENSTKFHPQHSPQIEINVTLSGKSELVLQVKDDGINMPGEQLDQVWLPYYQGNQFLGSDVAGMGLGLALVATIVWGAGGTCRMYNRYDGPGVVVEVSLPVEIRS